MASKGTAPRQISKSASPNKSFSNDSASRNRDMRISQEDAKATQRFLGKSMSPSPPKKPLPDAVRNKNASGPIRSLKEDAKQQRQFGKSPLPAMEKQPPGAGGKSPGPKAAAGKKTDAATMHRMSKEIIEKERQLEKLTIELRQKQRMLTEVNKGLEGVDTKLKEQLIAKDRLIQQINNKSIEKRVNEKEGVTKQLKDREIEIERLRKENKELLSLNQTTQDSLEELQERYNQEVEALTNEKEKAQSLHEVLNGEQEKLQNEAEVAKRQLSEARSDLENLAKIIHDMQSLNNELDTKVSVLNSEIEKLNAENFSLKAMKDSFQDLEYNLEHQVNENNTLIKEVRKLTTYNDYFQQEKFGGEEVYTQVQGGFNRLEGMLRELSASNGTSTTEIIKLQTEIRHMLKFHLLKQLPPNLEPSKTGKADLNDLKRELADKERLIMKLNNEQRSISSRLANQDAFITRMKQEAKEEEDRRQIRINRLTEENNRLKLRSENATVEIGKKDLQLASAASKENTTQSRINAQQRKVKDLSSKLLELEDANKKLRAKILTIQGTAEKREVELNARESRVSKSSNRMKAYEEELFGKDNELIKMARQLKLLENQNAELMQKNNKLSQTIQKMNENEIKGQNKKLQEKNSEIVVLKDMIRSSQFQVKAAEHDAQTMRHKSARLKPKDTGAIATILQIMGIFFGQIKEVQLWKADKLKQIKAANRNLDPMSTSTLSTMLQTDGLGQGNIDPAEAVLQAGRHKELKIANETQQRLTTAKRVKMQASELANSLRNDTLHRLLVSRDTISNIDLVNIIPDLI